MPRTQTTLPPAADPLGEVLHLLQLTGALYCRADLTAPWGINLPPLEGCMMFHAVTAGRVWLEIDGAEPRMVEQGSLVLVPHGVGHKMRSNPAAKAEPLFDIPVEQISDRYEIMQHGDGGEFTQTLCVVVQYEHAVAQHLVKLLPPALQIDTRGAEEDGWLSSTLRFLSREAKELRPGGETIITRLADILVIQMIRSWLDNASEPDQGWIAALRDEQIGRALTAMHRNPEQDWTVESLARHARMSRSAFSARFTDLVGQSAMRYLTQWRMQLARTQLRESSVPLAALAGRLGYQSEAAFSRAFKRVFGVSPGSVRTTDQPAQAIVTESSK